MTCSPLAFSRSCTPRQPWHTHDVHDTHSRRPRHTKVLTHLEGPQRPSLTSSYTFMTVLPSPYVYIYTVLIQSSYSPHTGPLHCSTHILYTTTIHTYHTTYMTHNIHTMTNILDDMKNSMSQNFKGLKNFMNHDVTKTVILEVSKTCQSTKMMMMYKNGCVPSPFLYMEIRHENSSLGGSKRTENHVTQ